DEVSERCGRLPPQPAAHFDTGQLRQVCVQQSHARTVLREKEPQGLLPVARAEHLIAPFRDLSLQQHPTYCIVVGDQYPHRISASSVRYAHPLLSTKGSLSNLPHHDRCLLNYTIIKGFITPGHLEWRRLSSLRSVAQAASLRSDRYNHPHAER